MDSATAVTMDAPTPWMPRATTSIACEVASPHARDASVNTPTPTISVARRPSRSAARPDRSISPPNVSMYALTTQARPALQKPRSA
jgi:hypothetical protein